MTTINLDAARAARAEALDEAPTVTFGGREFTLPVELPFGVFMRLAQMRSRPEESIDAMDALLTALLGDRKEEFLGLGPTLDDVQLLMEGMTGAYGMTVGEASASVES